MHHPNKLTSTDIQNMHIKRFGVHYFKYLGEYGLINLESTLPQKPIQMNDEEIRHILPLRNLYKAYQTYKMTQTRQKTTTIHWLIMSLNEFSSEMRYLIKKRNQSQTPLFARNIKDYDNHDIKYRPLFDLGVEADSEYCRRIAIPYLFIIHNYTIINFMHILITDPNSIHIEQTPAKSKKNQQPKPGNTISVQVIIL